MKALSDGFWSLYFEPDEIRIDGLKTIQVKAILRCLKPMELANWMTWEEGADDWRPAAETFRDLNKSRNLRNLPPTPPPIKRPIGKLLAETTKVEDKVNLENKTTKEESAKAEEHTEITTTRDYSEDTAQIDQRMSPRFKVNLKVFVVYQGRYIPNATEDLSMTGMKLRDSIPDHVNGTVTIVLINDQNELHMQCRIKHAPGEQTKTRLLIEVCNRADILRSWILSGKRAQAA